MPGNRFPSLRPPKSDRLLVNREPRVICNNVRVPLAPGPSRIHTSMVRRTKSQPPPERPISGNVAKDPGDVDLPDADKFSPAIGKRPVEIGGQTGPEPTRYGDWEKNGRCTDF